MSNTKDEFNKAIYKMNELCDRTAQRFYDFMIEFVKNFEDFDVDELNFDDININFSDLIEEGFESAKIIAQADVLEGH